LTQFLANNFPGRINHISLRLTLT